MRGVGSFLKRFGAARSGIAAIEFALILPFMALLYFGAIEVSLLITTDRKVTQTASALADLVARVDMMSPTEMSDVFDAARSMFAPSDVSTAKMRVTSIIDKDGVAEVEWSQARNMEAMKAGDKVTLEPGVMTTKGSVIMAEVVYPYGSTLGFFLKDGMQLRETFYLRPRQSDKVTWKAS